VSRGTRRHICRHIKAAANSVVTLTFMARFFITVFNIRHKLYISSGSTTTNKKTLVGRLVSFVSFYMITQESLNLVLSRKPRIFTAIRNGVLSDEVQNICFLIHAYAKQRGTYFQIPRDFRLLWRYVYEWAIVDTTCCVVIVSYRPVVEISVLCRLQCVRSHWNKGLSRIVS
jgi:hypothetical protein